MAGLKFDITGDNGNMLSALYGVQKGVRQTQQVVEQSGQGIEQMFAGIKSAAVSALGAFSAQQFASKVMNVRGQFQQLEVAFETMLGNAEDAKRLMDQLVKTAAKTPFDLQGIAQGAKQLLAYGIQADDVNETLVRLGDIAAGLSIPLNDLVYLYGTTMVQGRMFTQDLRQFQGRGIPIADELAKQFGVAKEKVGELVTAGKVGSEEMKKAIISMTSEGGKFAGLMDKQSHTITGQISNIEDAVDTMFNEIGKKSEGVINTGLSSVSYLVENWEKIGKVVLEVAVAYGSYKAALLAVLVAHKVQAIYGAMTAFLSLAKGVHTAKDAMLLFNLVSKANPIGLIVSVITSAAAAFYLFGKNTDAAAKAQESLNKIVEKAAEKAAEEKTKIDLLVAAAKNDKLSMEERKNAVNKLNEIIPNYNAQLDKTTGKYKASEQALKNYLVQLQRKYELEGAKEQIKEIGKKKAEARIKYQRGQAQADKLHPFNQDKEVNGGTFRSLAYGTSMSAGMAINKRVETNKDKRLQFKRRVTEDYKNSIKELDTELKAIDEAYGEDLQRNAAGQSEQVKQGTVGGTGKGGKGGHGKDNTRDEIAQRKYEIEAYKKEIERQNEEAELEIRQKQIDLKKDGYEKQRQQIQLNYDKLIYENKKREKQMIEALKENKFNKWMEKNPKASKKEQKDYKESLQLTKSNLNKQQQQQLKAYNDLTKQEQEQALKKLEEDRLQAERTSLNNLLKEYGTYIEKRQALEKEAEQKKQNIREDESITQGNKDAQIKAVNAGLKKSLSDLDFKELKENINWEYIFGDLNNTMPDVVAAVKDQLQQFIDTAKGLTPEQIQTVTDAIENLQARMDMSQPIKSIKQAHKEFHDAKAEYDKQLKAFQAAKKAGDKPGAEKAAKGMIKSSQKMTKAANKEKRSYKSVLKVVKDYANTLSDLGDSIGGNTGKMLKMAASAVTCGINMAQGIQSFKAALTNLERSVAILAIIQAALQALQLIMSLFSDDDKSTQNYIEGMGRYISFLKDNIKELNDSMRDVKKTIIETNDVFEELQQKRQEAAHAIREKSLSWLNSGASKGFLGIDSSASEGVKIADSLTSEQKDALKRYRGSYEFGRMGWIWDLADDEIIKLSEDAMAMSGLGDTLASSVKDYVEQIKAMRNGVNEQREALLGFSFNDFYDDFSDMLKDMDSDSEKFSQNFAEYMRNALTKDILATGYKSELEAIYKEAADIIKSGTHSGEEFESLKKRYKELSDRAKKNVESINQITGYEEEKDDEQKATANGAANITYEQANNITSLTTAGNITRERIKDIVNSVIANISSMVSISSSNSAVIVEIRNLMITNNSYLEDILRYTKSIYSEFSDKIDSVNKNLMEIR